MPLRVLIVSSSPVVAHLRAEVARAGGEPTIIRPDELEDRNDGLAEMQAVILDLRDPSLDADDLCAAVRDIPALREISLLAVVPETRLSAAAGRGDIDDFVVVPYREPELAARLRRIAGGSVREPSAQAMRFGDLVIDPETYDVTLRGARLDLTLKEYELLRFLVSRPGRVFTREQLLDAVWDHDYMGGTRTVDVHIRRLRAKLGDFGEECIDTTRGVGYSFRPPKTGTGYDFPSRT